MEFHMTPEMLRRLEELSKLAGGIPPIKLVGYALATYEALVRNELVGCTPGYTEPDGTFVRVLLQPSAK